MSCYVGGSSCSFFLFFKHAYHEKNPGTGLKNTEILSFAGLSSQYAKRYSNAGTSPEILYW